MTTAATVKVEGGKLVAIVATGDNGREVKIALSAADAMTLADKLTIAAEPLRRRS